MPWPAKPTSLKFVPKQAVGSLVVVTTCPPISKFSEPIVTSLSVVPCQAGLHRKGCAHVCTTHTSGQRLAMVSGGGYISLYYLLVGRPLIEKPHVSLGSWILIAQWSYYICWPWKCSFCWRVLEIWFSYTKTAKYTFYCSLEVLGIISLWTLANSQTTAIVASFFWRFLLY